MKKVLVADKMADEGIALLRERGCDVDVRLGMTPEEVLEAVPGYDALIVRSYTKVTREVIEAATDLKIIGRAGVTVNNIDIEAATEHGIIVCNAPTSNIVSAAEHTMCLILACARQVAQANEAMHHGIWDRSCLMGVELFGKTLAICGLGRIGGLVAERARAFGMNLIGYDPYCSPERADQLGVELVDSIDELLPAADFITVHLPRTSRTVGMFGPDEFARMKDGVILVNTATGGIFNEESLADFVAAGKIGAAAIDMFDEEPCTDSPLIEFENVILTPHIAAVTKDAQMRAGIQTAEFVCAGLEGSIVPTAVNMAPLPPEVVDAVGPYVPACQMMGRVIAQLLTDMPKSLKVTTAGAIAGTEPSILVAGALSGLLTYRRAGTVTPVNAEAVAQRHGIKVSSHSVSNALEYASTVTVASEGIEVGATLSGSAMTPRIVSLMGYRIDIVPGKQGLVFEYVDAPGRIGAIGTVLGNENVNITTMQIATKPNDQCALVYMNVEGDVNEGVLEKLRASLDLKNLWYISL